MAHPRPLDHGNLSCGSESACALWAVIVYTHHLLLLLFILFYAHWYFVPMGLEISKV